MNYSFKINIYSIHINILRTNNIHYEFIIKGTQKIIFNDINIYLLRNNL